MPTTDDGRGQRRDNQRLRHGGAEAGKQFGNDGADGQEVSRDDQGHDADHDDQRLDGDDAPPQLSPGPHGAGPSASL
jgi:hypothetical protein